MTHDGIPVVAKAVVSPGYEEEESFIAAQNECAVMNLLEKSGAPNVLRCLGDCRGWMRAEDAEKDEEVAVIVTAPFFEAASVSYGDLEDEKATARAMRETFYAASYMVAVGVANPDLQRNSLHKTDGQTLIIDFGLAYVFVPASSSSIESLGLHEFGFVESESLPTIALSDKDSVVVTMKNHIDVALTKGSELGVKEFESMWAEAWKAAVPNRRYATESARNAFWSEVQTIADETFHGRLLCRLLSSQRSLPFDDIKLALEYAPADGGDVWNKYKMDAIERADNALDFARDLEQDTAPIEDIISLLKNK